MEVIDNVATDGTKTCLRKASTASGAEAVLCIHGGTYDSGAVFGVAGPNGNSWFDAIRAAGRVPYGLDIRGYGDSDRPFDTEMRYDEPLVRASDAANDVVAAIETLRAAHERVHLIGFSWETVVCGYVLDTFDQSVSSISLVAPVYKLPYTYEEMMAALELETPIGGFRRVTKEDIRKRWDRQSDREPATAIRGGTEKEDPVFERFWEAIAQSRQRVEPDTIVAPNGVLADVKCGIEGAPVYDATNIETPTLLVRGSLDTTATREDALTLFDELGAGASRQYVEMAGATHMLPLENDHDALYGIVDTFHEKFDQ